MFSTRTTNHIFRTAIYFTTALLLLFAGNAHAEWRFNGQQFLVSAHGDMACVDCHSNIAEKELHPDPANVNQRSASSFNVETCFECHGDVEEEIEAGEHAGQTTEDADLNSCVDCHDPHTLSTSEDDVAAPLVFSDEDAVCMQCHDTSTAQGEQEAFCLSCHDQSAESAKNASVMTPVLDTKAFAKTPHASDDVDLDCSACHIKADAYPHNEQSLTACTDCHTPHKESLAHDAHIGVECGACHLKGVAALRHDKTGIVSWTKDEPEQPQDIENIALTNIHNMELDSEEGCERCHFEGTHIGAAASILPVKSVICMPCHTSTLTVGDSVSFFSLAVFLGGAALILLVALTAYLPSTDENEHPLRKLKTLLKGAVTPLSEKGNIVLVLKALFWDVLLLRRLWLRSRRRWVIHSLIYLPFVFRFFWGLIALTLSAWRPESQLGWAMVNKNAPLTALLFDISGLCILMGVGMALYRGVKADKEKLPGLPKQDKIALGLIFGIVLVGFVLEGMRISMTLTPDNSGFAFIGYIVSAFFSPQGASSGYGFVWYLHAILTGGFLAYLPFSKMSHIIAAPIALAMNALGGHGRHGNHEETHNNNE